MSGADELRAGRLRRLFPTPRRPGAHQRRTRRRGGTRHDRLSLGHNDLFYTSGPNPANLAFPSYLPDVTNNPLHGFEAAKNPNLPGANGGYAPQANGGMPADENVAAGIPDAYPTYDLSIRTNGLNEADEMNLYRPNPAAGFPLRPHRSRMALPVAGRRRPFAVEPAGRPGPDQLHQHHRRPTPSPAVRGRELGVEQVRLGQRQPPERVPVQQPIRADGQCQLRHGERRARARTWRAPSLAHRDKKINLNYPLPVSNDPNEPIRQKWISETYQLLKAVLPPRAVDTPEELAQLSQFVINIIDFRDPDCTMTHWQNPDVLLVPGQPANPSGSAPTPATAPTLVLASSNPANAIPLDQYGMEYNPVALNEVLAFSYAHYQGGGAQANRFFVELVNTLTQSSIAALPPPSPGGTNPPDPSILDLGGFQYTPGDPYSGGCWDLVFTDDTPNSRPDPYRGELVQGGQFYALIPLIKDSFTASPAGAAAGSSSKPGERRHAGAAGSGGRTVASGGQPGGEPSHPTDELLLRLRQQSSQPGVRDGDTVAHDLLSRGQRDRSQYTFAGAVPQPRGRPVQWAGDPEDHLVSGRAAGGRRGLRHLHGGRAAQLSVETSHPDRGEPEDEVLLGLPAPARQPVRPRVRGQSHAGRRRYALPLYRWHRP